jgi:hypothetical protein
MSDPSSIPSATRKIPPEQVALLRSLKPGQKIALVQTVRVGKRKWTTEVKGEFRAIDFLATGVTTDRIPEDDVIVPMLRFTKENGEHSSIAIDENSIVKAV